MQAFRVSPPLRTQIIIAIRSKPPHGETDVVQLNIRTTAITTNLEHEQFHRATFHQARDRLLVNLTQTAM